MSWTLTGDFARYVTEAEPFLRADLAENTVALTVIETLRAQGPDVFGPDPLFGWFHAGGVRGACLWTGTYPLLLSAMPEPAAESLAEVLTGRELTGVSGDAPAVRAFAARWERRTGTIAGVLMRQRLYRLESLEAGPLPSGGPRVAGASDRDLVHEWFAAFEQESGAGGTENPRLVDDRLSYGGVLLWEVAGEPVSLAARTRVVAGMTRIGPVYTPPDRRRQGYGAAVTAALTRSALDAGAGQVLLFTDLANPTSNGIYQRIGYRAVSDRLMLGFAER
ncbi:MAG: GNAT family N-acetyltransferase [Actinoallomurus sp.]